MLSADLLPTARRIWSQTKWDNDGKWTNDVSSLRIFLGLFSLNGYFFAFTSCFAFDSVVHRYTHPVFLDAMQRVFEVCNVTN
jgi:hypothetical protein